MTKPHRTLLVALVVVGSLVLLGQLWPAGAPPFARAVNVAFLIVALGYFAGRLTGRVG